MFLKSRYLSNRLLAFLAGATMLTSCTKDWLSETSPLQITSEKQFSSEGGFRDALIGVYITMCKPAGYGMDMTWHLMDKLPRYYSVNTGNSPYMDFQNFDYLSVRSRPIVDAMWNNSYNAIANINNALEQIDAKKSILNPINYNVIKGELLGLRAFLHFDLMRVFGHSNYAGRAELAGKPAIPYATMFSKQYAPQLSYTETFKLMEADIEASLALLKKDDPVYKGTQHPAGYYELVNLSGFYNNRELRMNYYAVLALKARVYMWEGKTAAVAALADEVISNAPAALITNAAGNTILKGEDLFTLNISQFVLNIDSYLDGVMNTNVNGIYILQTNAETLFETQNPQIGLVDYRYNSQLESQPLGRVPVKLRQLGKPGDQKNRMPLIRLSELYYMAAESVADTDLPKATGYLNTVRRARGILDDLTAGDKDAFMNELAKEYRKDFVSEGQVFFYYKRQGLVTYPGLPTNIEGNDKIYMLPFPSNELEFGGRVQ